MKSRIRKLASETAVYGVSSILGRAVNFLLFPFYSNVFPPEAYGPVVVIYAAFVFLNIVYQYGLESAYLKFSADAGSDAEKRRVFSTAVWSHAGTAALFSTVLWLFDDTVGAVIGLSPDHLKLVGYAAAILFVDTLVVVPFAELRLARRPWYFALVRLTSVLVNVGANLLLILGADMGIEAILIANLAASNTALLLLLPLFAKRLRRLFDRDIWREMMRFGLPFVPGGLGYALTERVNIFFLERMPTEQILKLYESGMPDSTRRAIEGGDLQAASNFVVGAYGGIIKLAVIGALAVQMFRYAWQPFFLQHAKDADARTLFARVFVIVVAGLFAVTLAISFFARELVSMPLPGGRTLIARAYWIGLPIVPVAILGYAFQGWYYLFSAGAYVKKKTRYFVHCTLAGAAFSLTTNVIFVPVYGMAAAAWATSGAYTLMALMLFAIVRQFYPVPYPWRRILIVTGSALSILALWYLRPDLQIWYIELALLALFCIVSAVTLKSTFRQPEAH